MNIVIITLRTENTPSVLQTSVWACWKGCEQTSSHVWWKHVNDRWVQFGDVIVNKKHHVCVRGRKQTITLLTRVSHIYLLYCLNKQRCWDGSVKARHVYLCWCQTSRTFESLQFDRRRFVPASRSLCDRQTNYNHRKLLLSSASDVWKLSHPHLSVSVSPVCSSLEDDEGGHLSLCVSLLLRCVSADVSAAVFT